VNALGRFVGGISTFVAGILDRVYRRFRKGGGEDDDLGGPPFAAA
jgi:hypothetical protein